MKRGFLNAKRIIGFGIRYYPIGYELYRKVF